MSETLQVVAIINVKPGHRAAVQAAFAPAIVASRAEPGCLRYELFADSTNAERLVMVEEWASKAALELHTSSAHFKELVRLAGALIDLDIIELTPLG
jgi:quinol monooxygenase YgiN